VVFKGNDLPTVSVDGALEDGDRFAPSNHERQTSVRPKFNSRSDLTDSDPAHILSEPMVEKRLTLAAVNPQNPLEVDSGTIVGVEVIVEGENVDAGVVTLAVDSPSIVILSAAEVPLSAGSYSERVNWSLGGHEPTTESPSGAAFVTITARAGALVRSVDFRVIVR
jgi:hypothetical protein